MRNTCTETLGPLRPTALLLCFVHLHYAWYGTMDCTLYLRTLADWDEKVRRIEVFVRPLSSYDIRYMIVCIGNEEKNRNERIIIIFNVID